ncbi:MAG: cytochrome c maturation protein CcmE [Bacteroidetes bacterium]|nr:cytochrome c maturation protein CcmE [Bacteroidota bacterium]
MKYRLVLGVCLIIVGIGLATVNLFESALKYGTFADARKTTRAIQVKGKWIREKGILRKDSVMIVFSMVDDEHDTTEVVVEGDLPQMFEHASSIVVRGKYCHGKFEATDILTKCPSKYSSP